MVRMIVVIALSLLVVAGGTAYASQASLPGDALYPVKLGTEQAGMMLPGDEVGRAERGLGFADRRIQELEALAEEGRSEYLELAAEKYGYALNMTLARIQEAMDKALAAENVTARVAEATMKHMAVLAAVYEEVPAEAKPAIERAIGESAAGYTAALGALEGAGVDVSQLPGMPEETRDLVEGILGGITLPTPGPPGGGPPAGRP